MVTEELAKESIENQLEFFYRIFPAQVDVGQNKLSTLDWLLSRTRDGTKTNAPRELIHLLNSLRDVQIKRLEVGEGGELEGDFLFSRPSFKIALPEVSKVRLEQTIYAEFPKQKTWIEKLRGAKTLQTSDTLAELWGVSAEEAIRIANDLTEIGLFEPKGAGLQQEYWVPFLYRDELDLVQGSAE